MSNAERAIEASVSELSRWVWEEKYRYYEPDGTSKEERIRDTHRRVIEGVYAKDQFAAQYKPEATELMDSLAWCPAGRIHANAGTPKRVTSINCFVSPNIQDSLSDVLPDEDGLPIMKALEVAAITQQMGGGIGMDFSPLRPSRAVIKRTGSMSMGPLPWMGMWDSMCAGIKSSGHRRGAMMGVMRIDHPDILKFVKAKHEKGVLENFNVSVLVPHAFMQALKNDENWMLGFHVPRADGAHVDVINTKDGPWYVYEIVKATELWDEIIRSTFEFAEPGIIFIDRVNEMNNLQYCEYIHACNPCFTADTKVWTIDGPIPFDKLAKEGKDIKVLTQLEDGKLAWRVMKNPRRTQKNHSLVEVTIRGSGKKNGSVTKFRCTPEHEIFLRCGSSKQAQNLQPGDRIASAYRWRCNKTMYRFSNGDDKVLEHHLAAETEHGRRPVWPLEHGHHKDENRANNRPSNIEIKDASKHNSDHMLGDKNPMRRFPEKNHFKQVTYAGEQNGRWRNDVETSTLQELKDSGLSFAAIAKKVGCSKYTVMNRLGWERPSGNHTVISVKALNKREDVYCGTVPDTGRFFISVDNDEGVLVSNCGEQPLPPNGDCNLGAVNLAKMVREYFTKRAYFDFDLLRYAVRTGVRFLDNVLDTSLFPTQAQKEEALAKRRIGLGITGLGNMLQMMMLRYGGADSIRLIDILWATIRDTAYETSIELAKERGPFPLFDRDKYCNTPFIKSLPDNLQKGIYEHGIRNAVLLTIAPTGTTSMYYENVSSGIEPTIAWTFKRKMREADGSYKEVREISDYGFELFKKVTGWKKGDPLPDYMCSALEEPNVVTVDEHLAVQAVCQKYIDASISKTINCPVNIPYEDFKEVYTKAYDLGLKGCTTYKPSAVRGSVISVDEAEKPATTFKEITVEPRPDELVGYTYKVKYPGIEHAFYVTINDIQYEDGRRQPFEIFINSKSITHQEWIVALTRMISAIFRRGGDVTFIVEELKQVFSARGGAFVNRKFVPSIVALIGNIVEKHFIKIGLLNLGGMLVPEELVPAVKELISKADDVLEMLHGETCPNCQAPTYFRQEGCYKCTSCFYSSCG